MKRLKKIISKIILGLLILIFIYNVYNFVCFKILKYDIVPINGYALLEVVSDSMYPTIKKGDLIVINMKAKSYQANDIITFYDSENNFVTHRLISITDAEIVTKGDHNKSNDQASNKDAIVGKYLFKISGGGKVLAALKNPIVMIIIFIIGFLICIIISTDKNLLMKSQEYLDFKKYLENKNEPHLKEVTTKKRKHTKNNNKKKRKRKKRKRSR